MKLALLCAPLCAMIATAAVAAEPAGTVVAEFTTGSASEIAAKIAASCMEKGWVVAAQSELQTECEGEPDPMTALRVASARHLTATRGVIRFSILSAPDRIRVQAYAYSEITTTFGAMRQVPFELLGPVKVILAASGGTIKDAAE